MFKSVFAKYVTAFMTIITFGFVILLLIVTSTVSHYSTSAKADLMDHVAQILREDLEEHLEKSEASESSKNGLAQLPRSIVDEEAETTVAVTDRTPSEQETGTKEEETDPMDPEQTTPGDPDAGDASREDPPEDVVPPLVISKDAESSMKRIFSAFAFNSNDKLSVWVADVHGNILFAAATSDEKTSFGYGQRLPAEVVTALQNGDDYLGTVVPDSSEIPVLMRCLGVYYEDGSMCGMIAVGSSNVRWGSMVEDLSKTVITAAMLVILAALIAAYFVTEFTVQPLREMNLAARNFAAGRFGSRVVVRGKDEVAQLAEAFNQMAESLENLETMRNSFVANVSHDLRTPMTTISGFIDAIRDGVIPPDQVDHYLEVISKEVHRLSRLVATLLDLSRLQTGDRKFVMKAFDICEMARIIVISFEQRIEEKRLEVDFQCNEDRIFVMADHDAIYQVFYNICHNAVKFSKNGGVLRIRILENKEKKICVSVYNEGEGIPREDLPLIFERFYKSDKSRGLDKSGVGLGLFICKTIITAHGEKIWVTSQSGKNCEFSFTLSRTHGNIHPLDG